MADGQLTFLFQLDGKIDAGIPKALKQAEDGLKGVEEKLKKVDQGYGKLRDQHGRFIGGMGKHDSAVKHTEGLLSHFASATLGPLAHRMERIAEFEFIRRGVDALIEAPMEALHLFKELAVEMINVAAQAERTELSFKLLFGETEGKETLEWIEKISKFTEFTDDQLKGMAGSLAKVGFEGEGLTRALAASLDIAAFSGSGQAGADSALSSLERIKRTGKIDNRSLGGLGIGESAFLAELSRRTGEGTKALKKKIDEGKISAEDSLEALYSMIAKKTGKDLGGAGVAMSQTLMARLKHLKDLPEQFFQKLAGTEGFNKISEFVGRLVDIFDPEGEIGVAISGTLNKLFDEAGDKLSGIDLEGMFRNVPAAIESVTSSLSAMWDAFKPFIDAFKAVAATVEWINEKTGTGSYSKQAATNKQFRIDNPELAAEGDRLRRLLADKKAATMKGRTWEDPEKVFGPQETYVDRSARRAKEAGKLSADGFVRGLDGHMFDVEYAGAGLGRAAINGVEKKLDLHSPSRVFERMGEMTGAGFNRGITKSMADTDDVMKGAFAVPAPTGGAHGRTEINLGGIHVTVGAGAGSDARQIGETVAAKIQEIAPGMLQSALERLAIQAGGA